MNKNQLVLLQQVFDVVQSKGLNPDSVQEKHLVDGIKKENPIQRVPWKIFEEYKKPDGNFNLTSLFKQEIDMVIDPHAESDDTDEEEIETPEDEVIEDSDEEEQEEELEEPAVKKRKTRKITKIPESKKKIYKDPVYVVESIDCSKETAFVGIARNFETSWDVLKYQAIHDHGTISYEDAEVQIETTGVVIVQSVHSSNLCCVITKVELF